MGSDTIKDDVVDPGKARLPIPDTIRRQPRRHCVAFKAGRPRARFRAGNPESRWPDGAMAACSERRLPAIGGAE
jgi:hypothetical protein